MKPWEMDLEVEDSTSKKPWEMDLGEDELQLTQEKEDSPSMLGSGLAGAKQGVTFGFEDELGGALEAIGSTLGIKGLGQSFSDMGFEKPYWMDEGTTIGDVYRRARDKRREYASKAQEANPMSFMAGELASAAVPLGGAGKIGQAASKALGLGGKIPGNVVAGGVQGVAEGTLAGLGASEADDLGGMIADAAGGGVIGGTVGSVLPMGTEALKGMARGVAPIVKPVAKTAKDAQNYILSKFTTREVSKADLDGLFDDYVNDRIVPGDSFPKIKEDLKRDYASLQNDVFKLGKDAKKILSDDSFNTKMDDIVDVFDQAEDMWMRRNPAAGDDAIKAVKDAKKQYNNYRNQSYLRINQIKEDAKSINDEVSAMKKKYYDDAKEMNFEEQLLGEKKNRLSELQSKFSKYYPYMNTRTGHLSNYENVPEELRRSEFLNRIDFEANNYFSDIEDVADSVQYRKDGQDFLKEVNDGFDEIRSLKEELNLEKKDFVKMQNNNKQLGKRIGELIFKKDKLKDEYNSLSSDIEKGLSLADEKGFVSGAGIKSIVKDLDKRIKNWEKNRKAGGSPVSEVQESYWEDVRKVIDNKFLKGKDVSIEDNRFKWKEDESPFSTPQSDYQEVMSEMAEKESARKAFGEDFLGEGTRSKAKKDSLINKLKKIGKGGTGEGGLDIEDEGLARTLSDFDEVTGNEYFNRLRTQGRVDKFDPEKVGGTQDSILNKIMAQVINPGAKQLMRAEAGTSKALKAMSEGKFAKLGKHAPKFIEAFQEGGIPRVTALEFQLMQQDPNYLKDNE